VSSVEQVQRFREKLVQAIGILEEHEDSNFVRSVLRGLLVEYNKSFPAHVYLAPRAEYIQADIDRFCNPDITKCPICSSMMTQRRAKSTSKPFWGCSQYPRCKGTRTQEGKVTLSEAVKEHIAAKLLEEQTKLDTHPHKRFLSLELNKKV